MSAVEHNIWYLEKYKKKKILFWIPVFFKKSLFCVPQKENYTGLE